MKMKGYAMLKLGETGWIEKDVPACGPLDAICKPLALAPCTSDVHTVWEGAIGDRHDMILGHEGCGEVVEVGSLVKDFKPGDKVLVPAITPDWNSLEAQGGYSMHSGGMLAGWKFSNFKDGVFGEYFHVNDADGNLALIPDGIKIEHAPMLSDMVPTGFHIFRAAFCGNPQKTGFSGLRLSASFLRNGMPHLRPAAPTIPAAFQNKSGSSVKKRSFLENGEYRTVFQLAESPF